LRQLATHGRLRDFHAVTLKNLLLSVPMAHQ
jgi:hypothetical protein